MKEKRWDVTNYLDFALPHFEPVHLNLFLLISSSSKMSRSNGLLPTKQRWGELGHRAPQQWGSCQRKALDVDLEA